MIIGIDAYEANTIKRVGIGQYAFKLLWYIHQIDRQNKYLLFLPNPPLSDMPGKDRNWQYIVGKPLPLWTITQLPLLSVKHKNDLFFSPTHYCPWFIGVPKIISIMDLSYLHFPEMFRLQNMIQLRYLTAYSIKRARKILTISNFTKQEIIEHYKYPVDDIIVTYPGVNRYKLQSANSTSIIKNNLFQKQKNIQPFILFVGTLQPRKNISRLIKAFEQIEQNINLVLVGKKGWLYEPIFEMIDKSDRTDQIIWLDYVTENELSCLFQSAICLVLPSLYEGFGLPVVEAMNAGCPVVISNTSSLPEIAGPAGIYINPESIEDIASGIKKALQLSPEQRRILIEKGKHQAKNFSWDNCARKTLEVFKQIF